MKRSLYFAFSFIGQIGFTTALPLVILGILGRYLDKTYNTGYIFFLVGIGTATIIIVLLMYKIIVKAEEEFKKISE